MKNQDIQIITAPPDEVEINQNELAARLKVNRGYQSDALDRCRQRLLEVITYQCAYIRTAVDLSVENRCDFGFMTIDSKNLYRNRNGCREAFVMAVTTGIGVDRLLARLNVSSQAEHFMTDALSSAAGESFCDYVSDKMKTGIRTAPRFSPGYGDVSIEVQKPLLDRLNAAQLLGITLNNAYLMTPVKSITAIMGVRQ